MEKKPHTHTAYGVMQMGRGHREARAVGTGTIDKVKNTATIYTDRIVRRDTGMILLIPHGHEPPDLNAKPPRPGEVTNADDDIEDGAD